MLGLILNVACIGNPVFIQKTEKNTAKELQTFSFRIWNLFLFSDDGDHFRAYMPAVNLLHPFFFKASVKRSGRSICFHQAPLALVFPSSGAQLATAVWLLESGKKQGSEIDFRSKLKLSLNVFPSNCNLPVKLIIPLWISVIGLKKLSF